MLRDALKNVDANLGRWVPLKHAAFIAEPRKAGQGVYGSADWSTARKLGFRGVGERERTESDADYLRSLFSNYAYAMHAALRLADTLDLGAYRSVFEIGCGEMFQAFVIKSLYPDMRYRATDFDPYVIEWCARIPILGGIEKAELDVATLTAETIRGFHLILMWELLYALDDAKLETLFRAASEARIPILACTSQLTGPLRAMLRSIKNLNWRPGGFYYARMVDRGEFRMHGWNHSAGFYETLARKCRMSLARVWTPPATVNGAIERFAYLLFEPMSA